jgi:hypothetical protein
MPMSRKKELKNRRKKREDKLTELTTLQSEAVGLEKKLRLQRKSFSPHKKSSSNTRKFLLRTQNFIPAATQI